MSEFEHMKRLLENTGLYAITDNSLIKAELMAYAAGLDTYFTALDELKRECFVATATTYGLQYREDMLRRPNFRPALNSRRNALLKAFSITASDNTLEGMEKLRDSFNVHGTFSFDPATMTITFTCTDNLIPVQRSLLEYQMRPFMPVWCQFTVV